MKARLAILFLLVSACVVEARPRPPPPVMPPQEAVAIAAHFARSRGLVIDTTRSAWLGRTGRWHVDLTGAGGRDRAVVVVDGFSGQVLSARLRGPRGEYAPVAPPPAAGGPPPSMPPQGVPPPPPGTPPAPPGTPPAPPAPGSPGAPPAPAAPEPPQAQPPQGQPPPPGDEPQAPPSQPPPPPFDG